MPLPAGVVMHTAPRADHHVGPFRQQRPYQLFGILRRVGPVAVGDDVDVGIDIGKHAAHHMAFALAPLAHDLRAGKHGMQRCAVSGIVVVDVDMRIGQGRPEPPDNSTDRRRFVVAGKQNGNIRTFAERSRHGVTLVTKKPRRIYCMQR